MTVHRGTVQDKSKTVIGDGNLLMAYSHVGHDCEVGNHNVFANTAGLAGHVKLGNHVTLGAVTLIHQFCHIGDHSFTGLNTFITMDIPAFVKVAANPARPIGLNSIGMQRNNFDVDTINLIMIRLMVSTSKLLRCIPIEFNPIGLAGLAATFTNAGISIVIKVFRPVNE